MLTCVVAEERAANEKRKMSVDSPVGAPSLPVAPPRPAPQAAQPESEEEEDDDDKFVTPAVSVWCDVLISSESICRF